jgi:ribosomal protein L11
MKKATFEIMLGKKTRCLYKRIIAKTTILRANLPVGKATSTQALRTAFGNYGLNLDEFCSFFNAKSVIFWEEHLLIPIVILITPAKTYLIEYKLPTVYSLYDKVFKFKTKNSTHFIKPNIRKLVVATAYKIAILSSQSTNSIILRKYTEQILGSFRSYNLFSPTRFAKVKLTFRKKIKPTADIKKKKKK